MSGASMVEDWKRVDPSQLLSNDAYVESCTRKSAPPTDHMSYAEYESEYRGAYWPFQPRMDDIANTFTQTPKARAVERRRTFMKRFTAALNVTPQLLASGGPGGPAGAARSGASATGIPANVAHLFPAPSPSAILPPFTPGSTAAERTARAAKIAALLAADDATAAAKAPEGTASPAAVAVADPQTPGQQWADLIGDAVSSKRLVTLISTIEALRKRIAIEEKQAAATAASAGAAAAAATPAPTTTASSTALNLSTAYERLADLIDAAETALATPAPVRYGGATTFATKLALQRRQMNSGDAAWRDDPSTGQLTQVCSQYGSHAIALNADGLVYVWGDNTKYQCGIPHSPPQIPNPTLLTIPFVTPQKKIRCVEVGCGEFFSVILDEAGRVYTMGTNYLGQGDNARATMPVALDFADPNNAAAGSRRIAKIAAGQRHALAYAEADDAAGLVSHVYAWGNSGNYQCGLGVSTETRKPTALKELKGLAMAQIACGQTHSFALTTTGALWSWGGSLAQHSAHGHGTKTQQKTPKVVDTFVGEGVKVVAVYSGYNHVFAISLEKRVLPGAGGSSAPTPKAAKAAPKQPARRGGRGGRRGGGRLGGGDSGSDGSGGDDEPQQFDDDFDGSGGGNRNYGGGGGGNDWEEEDFASKPRAKAPAKAAKPAAAAASPKAAAPALAAASSSDSKAATAAAKKAPKEEWVQVFWSWGANSYGQLGNGNARDVPRPQRVHIDALTVNNPNAPGANPKVPKTQKKPSNDLYAALDMSTASTSASSSEPVARREKPVIWMSCNDATSVLITDDGEVFGCGAGNNLFNQMHTFFSLNPNSFRRSGAGSGGPGGSYDDKMRMMLEQQQQQQQNSGFGQKFVPLGQHQPPGGAGSNDPLSGPFYRLSLGGTNSNGNSLFVGIKADVHTNPNPRVPATAAAASADAPLCKALFECGGAMIDHDLPPMVTGPTPLARATSDAKKSEKEKEKEKEKDKAKDASSMSTVPTAPTAPPAPASLGGSSSAAPAAAPLVAPAVSARTAYGILLGELDRLAHLYYLANPCPAPAGAAGGGAGGAAGGSAAAPLPPHIVDRRQWHEPYAVDVSLESLGVLLDTINALQARIAWKPYPAAGKDDPKPEDDPLLDLSAVPKPKPAAPSADAKKAADQKDSKEAALPVEKKLAAPPAAAGIRMELTVPSAQVGLLIGRGGDTIRRLQSESGARVQVTPAAAGAAANAPRSVVLIGRQSEVDAASAEIIRLCSTPNAPVTIVSSGPDDDAAAARAAPTAGRPGLGVADRKADATADAKTADADDKEKAKVKETEASLKASAVAVAAAGVGFGNDAASPNSELLGLASSEAVFSFSPSSSSSSSSTAPAAAAAPKPDPSLFPAAVHAEYRDAVALVAYLRILRANVSHLIKSNLNFELWAREQQAAAAAGGAGAVGQPFTIAALWNTLLSLIERCAPVYGRSLWSGGFGGGAQCSVYGAFLYALHDEATDFIRMAFDVFFPSPAAKFAAVLALLVNNAKPAAAATTTPVIDATAEPLLKAHGLTVQRHAAYTSPLLVQTLLGSATDNTGLSSVAHLSSFLPALPVDRFEEARDREKNSDAGAGGAADQKTAAGPSVDEEQKEVDGRLDLLFVLLKSLVNFLAADTQQSLAQTVANHTKSLAAAAEADAVRAKRAALSDDERKKQDADAKEQWVAREAAAKSEVRGPFAFPQGTWAFRSFWVQLQAHLLARLHKLYTERTVRSSAFAYGPDAHSPALRRLLQSVVVHCTAFVPFVIRYVHFVLDRAASAEALVAAVADDHFAVACNALRRSHLAHGLPPLVVALSILPHPLPAALSHTLFHAVYARILVHDRVLAARLNAIDRATNAADAKRDAERTKLNAAERELWREKLATARAQRDKERAERAADLKKEADAAAAERDAERAKELAQDKADDAKLDASLQELAASGLSPAEVAQARTDALAQRAEERRKAKAAAAKAKAATAGSGGGATGPLSASASLTKEPVVEPSAEHKDRDLQALGEVRARRHRRETLQWLDSFQAHLCEFALLSVRFGLSHPLAVPALVRDPDTAREPVAEAYHLAALDARPPEADKKSAKDKETKAKSKEDEDKEAKEKADKAKADAAAAANEEKAVHDPSYWMGTALFRMGFSVTGLAPPLGATTPSEGGAKALAAAKLVEPELDLDDAWQRDALAFAAHHKAFAPAVAGGAAAAVDAKDGGSAKPPALTLAQSGTALPPPSVNLRRQLSIRSLSTVVTPRDAQEFLESLIAGAPGTAGAVFYAWLQKQNQLQPAPGSTHAKTSAAAMMAAAIKQPVLDRAVRASLAAILHHHGLVTEALCYARLLTPAGGAGAAGKSAGAAPAATAAAATTVSAKWKPKIPELLSAYVESEKLRDPLIREGRAVDARMAHVDKERAYRLVSEPLIAAAQFLLRVAPSPEIIALTHAVSLRHAQRDGGDDKHAAGDAKDAKAAPGAALSSAARERARINWQKLRNCLKIVRHFSLLKAGSFLDQLTAHLSDRSCYREIAMFLREHVPTAASVTFADPNAPAAADAKADAKAAAEKDSGIGKGRTPEQSIAAIEDSMKRRTRLAAYRAVALYRLCQYVTDAGAVPAVAAAAGGQATAPAPASAMSVAALTCVRQAMNGRSAMDSLDGCGREFAARIRSQFTALYGLLSRRLQTVDTAAAAASSAAPATTSTVFSADKQHALGVWLFRLATTSQIEFDVVLHSGVLRHLQRLLSYDFLTAAACAEHEANRAKQAAQKLDDADRAAGLGPLLTNPLAAGAGAMASGIVSPPFGAEGGVKKASRKAAGEKVKKREAGIAMPGSSLNQFGGAVPMGLNGGAAGDQPDVPEPQRTREFHGLAWKVFQLISEQLCHLESSTNSLPEFLKRLAEGATTAAAAAAPAGADPDNPTANPVAPHLVTVFGVLLSELNRAVALVRSMAATQDANQQALHAAAEARQPAPEPAPGSPVTFASLPPHKQAELESFYRDYVHMLLTHVCQLTLYPLPGLPGSLPNSRDRDRGGDSLAPVQSATNPVAHYLSLNGEWLRALIEILNAGSVNSSLVTPAGGHVRAPGAAAAHDPLVSFGSATQLSCVRLIGLILAAVPPLQVPKLVFGPTSTADADAVLAYLFGLCGTVVLNEVKPRALPPLPLLPVDEPTDDKKSADGKETKTASTSKAEALLGLAPAKPADAKPPVAHVSIPTLSEIHHANVNHRTSELDKLGAVKQEMLTVLKRLYATTSVPVAAAANASGAAATTSWHTVISGFLQRSLQATPAALADLKRVAAERRVAQAAMAAAAPVAAGAAADAKDGKAVVAAAAAVAPTNPYADWTPFPRTWIPPADSVTARAPALYQAIGRALIALMVMTTDERDGKRLNPDGSVNVNYKPGPVEALQQSATAALLAAAQPKLNESFAALLPALMTLYGEVVSSLSPDTALEQAYGKPKAGAAAATAATEEETVEEALRSFLALSLLELLNQKILHPAMLKRMAGDDAKAVAVAGSGAHPALLSELVAIASQPLRLPYIFTSGSQGNSTQMYLRDVLRRKRDRLWALLEFDQRSVAAKQAAEQYRQSRERREAAIVQYHKDKAARLAREKEEKEKKDKADREAKDKADKDKSAADAKDGKAAAKSDSAPAAADKPASKPDTSNDESMAAALAGMENGGRAFPSMAMGMMNAVPSPAVGGFGGMPAMPSGSSFADSSSRPSWERESGSHSGGVDPFSSFQQQQLQQHIQLSVQQQQQQQMYGLNRGPSGSGNDDWSRKMPMGMPGGLVPGSMMGGNPNAGLDPSQMPPLTADERQFQSKYLNMREKRRKKKRRIFNVPGEPAWEWTFECRDGNPVRATQKAQGNVDEELGNIAADAVGGVYRAVVPPQLANSPSLAQYVPRQHPSQYNYQAPALLPGPSGSGSGGSTTASLATLNGLTPRHSLELSLYDDVSITANNQLKDLTRGDFTVNLWFQSKLTNKAVAAPNPNQPTPAKAKPMSKPSSSSGSLADRAKAEKERQDKEKADKAEADAKKAKEDAEPETPVDRNAVLIGCFNSTNDDSWNLELRKGNKLSFLLNRNPSASGSNGSGNGGDDVQRLQEEYANAQQMYSNGDISHEDLQDIANRLMNVSRGVSALARTPGARSVRGGRGGRGGMHTGRPALVRSSSAANREAAAAAAKAAASKPAKPESTELVADNVKWNDGAWHNVCAVRRGTTVRVYFDGVRVAKKQDTAGPFVASSNRVYVGRDHRNGQDHHFAGLVKNVTILSQALTKSQVSAVARGVFVEDTLDPNQPRGTAASAVSTAPAFDENLYNAVRTALPPLPPAPGSAQPQPPGKADAKDGKDSKAAAADGNESDAEDAEQMALLASQSSSAARVSPLDEEDPVYFEFSGREGFTAREEGELLDSYTFADDMFERREFVHFYSREQFGRPNPLAQASTHHEQLRERNLALFAPAALLRSLRMLDHALCLLHAREGLTQLLTSAAPETGALTRSLFDAANAAGLAGSNRLAADLLRFFVLNVYRQAPFKTPGALATTSSSSQQQEDQWQFRGRRRGGNPRGENPGQDLFNAAFAIPQHDVALLSAFLRLVLSPASSGTTGAAAAAAADGNNALLRSVMELALRHVALCALPAHFDTHFGSRVTEDWNSVDTKNAGRESDSDGNIECDEDERAEPLEYEAAILTGPRLELADGIFQVLTTLLSQQLALDATTGRTSDLSVALQRALFAPAVTTALVTAERTTRNVIVKHRVLRLLVTRLYLLTQSVEQRPASAGPAPDHLSVLTHVALLPLATIIKRIDERYTRENGRAFSSPLLVAWFELALAVKHALAAHYPHPILLSQLATKVAALPGGAADAASLQAILAGLPRAVLEGDAKSPVAAAAPTASADAKSKADKEVKGGDGQKPPAPQLLVDSVREDRINISWLSNRPIPNQLAAGPAAAVGGAKRSPTLAPASSSSDLPPLMPGLMRQNTYQASAAVVVPMAELTAEQKVVLDSWEWVLEMDDGKNGAFKEVYAGPALSFSTTQLLTFDPSPELTYRFRVRSQRASPTAGAPATHVSDWSETIAVHTFYPAAWNPNGLEVLGMDVLANGRTARRSVQALMLRMANQNDIGVPITVLGNTRLYPSKGVYTWRVRIDHCSTHDMWIGVLPSNTPLRERQGNGRSMFNGVSDPLNHGSYLQVRSGQIWKLQFNAQTNTLVCWCNGRYLGCPLLPGPQNNGGSKFGNNNSFGGNAYALMGGNSGGGNGNGEKQVGVGNMVQLPKLPDGQYYVAAACFMQPEDGVTLIEPTWSTGGNVERAVERMYLLSQFADALHTISTASAGPVHASLPFSMFELAFARFRHFSTASVRRLETETEWLSLDVSGTGLDKHFKGYGVGDTVETALGTGVVLGGVVHQMRKELPPPPVEQAAYKKGGRQQSAAAAAEEAAREAAAGGKKDKDAEEKEKERKAKEAQAKAAALAAALQPKDVYTQVAVMIEGSQEPVLMNGGGLKKLIRKKKRYTADGKESAAEKAAMSATPPPMATVSQFYSVVNDPEKWTIERDVKLVAMANYLCDTLRVTPWELLRSDITTDAQYLDASWKQLRTVPIQELWGRWCLLCEFNHQLSTVLTHLDLPIMTASFPLQLAVPNAPPPASVADQKPAAPAAAAAAASATASAAAAPLAAAPLAAPTLARQTSIPRRRESFSASTSRIAASTAGVGVGAASAGATWSKTLTRLLCESSTRALVLTTVKVGVMKRLFDATAKHNKPQEWVETLIPMDFPHLSFDRRQAVDARTRLVSVRQDIARETQQLTKALLAQQTAYAADPKSVPPLDPAVAAALALGNKAPVDSPALRDYREHERSLLESTYFGQSRQLFDDWSVDQLRRDYLAPKVIDDPLNQDLQTRAFKVQFNGEDAQDLGGPYRAIFSEWASELQSDVLPLFVASPNQQIKTDRHNDTFVLNPACRAFDWFARVGKVIGLALRNGITLPFSLPTVFWKKLVNLQPQRRDLERIDIVGAKAIAAVEAIFRGTSAGADSKAAPTPTDNSAEAVAARGAAVREALGHHDTFIVRLSDGTIRELVQGGGSVRITSANYEQWVRLAVDARLNESNPQMLAVLDGLAAVIPLPYFNLFTHTELDWLCCGQPDYDVAELRSRSQYKQPVQETDPSTAWLWEVLAELDRPGRAQFLFFVRGARRLGKDDRLHIARLTSSAVPDHDRLLPQASTCFFELKLPPYSTKDLLRAKLVLAMNECITMALN